MAYFKFWFRRFRGLGPYSIKNPTLRLSRASARQTTGGAINFARYRGLRVSQLIRGDF